ncbi:MAG: site-specific integrase [Myxococcales bacterium]|nr:site-specific integrase [Myxococcales bacterium]
MASPIKHHGKWRIRWIDERGGRHSEVYDDRRDAVLKLKQREAAVEEVRRGLRKPIIEDKTFDQICDYWLANRATRKRSQKDDESIIRRHLRPFFTGIKLRAFGVERVDAFITAKAALDKKTVHNFLTLLISMLRVAAELGWLSFVPPIKKPQVRLFSRDYQYLRTDDELRRFLGAARDEGELVFATYATAAYTGLRAGELAGLQWSDVDFERRMITVQRSFDGPTKADDVRWVPILDPLLPVLRAWRLLCPSAYVFPNQEGEMQQPSNRIFQEILHRVLGAAGMNPVKRGQKDRPYITFHGLRHTFASHWMMKGGDLFRLQKILGHKNVQMTMRYAHLSPSAFEGDHGRMGDQKLLGAGGKVVPLKPARVAAPPADPPGGSLPASTTEGSSPA